MDAEQANSATTSTNQSSPNTIQYAANGNRTKMYSSTVSEGSCSSEAKTHKRSEDLANNCDPAAEMYQLKTMCLAKKVVHLPNKEEHGFLLFCGLGARKWQINIEVNSVSFREAVLNIYPRLRTVGSYTLWTLSKDKKTFERLPEKVNTPKRIRTYLGSGFSGCLIVVPIIDLVLMEEKRDHILQKDIRIENGKAEAGDLAPAPRQIMASRSFCLICGKMEKAPGTGTFHKILDESITTENGNITIAGKLKDILGIDLPKPKWVASDEICKKCLRTVCDVVNLEEQLRRDKEELVSSFFSTTSKIHKSHAHLLPELQSGGVSPPRSSMDKPVSEPFTRIPLPTAFPAPILLAPHVAQPTIAFFNQQPFFYQPYQREEGPNYRDNSRHGSEYAASEVGESSYMSVSPRLQPEFNNYDNQETESMRSISPRPFDNRSYASTFSLKSYQSSVRSKAEYKSYDNHFSGSERGQVSETDNKAMYSKVQGEEQETPENLSMADSVPSPTSSHVSASPPSSSPPSASPPSSISPPEVSSSAASPQKPWKKRSREIQMEESREEEMRAKKVKNDDVETKSIESEQVLDSEQTDSQTDK